MKAIGRTVTQHRSTVQCIVTITFLQRMTLRNGIVSWEMLEQNCQQSVWMHTTVVQTGQAGWMVLIPHLRMVKFNGQSASVTVPLVANTQ